MGTEGTEHFGFINITPDPITAANAENWFAFVEDRITHKENKGLPVHPAGIDITLRGPLRKASVNDGRGWRTQGRSYFFTCGPLTSPKRETFEEMNADLQAFLNIVTKGKMSESDS